MGRRALLQGFLIAHHRGLLSFPGSHLAELWGTSDLPITVKMEHGHRRLGIEPECSQQPGLLGTSHGLGQG